MNKKYITNLKSLLNKKNFNFNNYQQIPNFITKELLKNSIELNYKQDQLSLDKLRLEFLTKHLNKNPKKITEIGSNLGYFVFSLAKKYDSKIIGYEPIKHYSQITKKLSEFINLKKNIIIKNKSVKLEDIKKLLKTNLIIELNVLHHAGNYFDKNKVKKLGGWRNYALKRLSLLKTKSDYLFFQTGNSGLEQHFKSEDSVKFVSKLLKDSGWKIKAFGTIKNLDLFKYTKGNLNNNKSFVEYNCSRNLKKHLVDYKIKNKLLKSLKTGMAARPIWVCKNK